MTRLCGASSPAEQRESGVQCQSTCKLCPESHKTQVWLCFLVLSLLSTCVAAVPDTEDLQRCVKDLRVQIEESDAMLYAPSIDDIKDHCTNMSLKCYMLELMMVCEEKEVPDNLIHCINVFNDELPTDDGCPCEVYSQENITIFLERLNDLLKKTTAETA